MIVAGAAGMLIFEKGQLEGLASFSAALWWTAMLIMTMGSNCGRRQVEGRLPLLLLSLCGFAVCGYLKAVLSTFYRTGCRSEPIAALVCYTATFALWKLLRVWLVWRILKDSLYQEAVTTCMPSSAAFRRNASNSRSVRFFSKWAAPRSI